MASEHQSRHTRAPWGIAALLLGATSISLGVIAAKEAYGAGADPQGVLAARLLVAGVVIVPFLPWVLRAAGRPVRPGALSVAIWAWARSYVKCCSLVAGF
jgi:hypothetical protein